jgi:hypothetical protein
MKRNFRTAFNQLKKMGVPVYEHREWHFSEFVIDAEEGNKIWADYHSWDFGLMGVSQKIVDVLDKQGLHTQWIDAGTLGVYE